MDFPRELCGPPEQSRKPHGQASPAGLLQTPRWATPLEFPATGQSASPTTPRRGAAGAGPGPALGEARVQTPCCPRIPSDELCFSELPASRDSALPDSVNSALGLKAQPRTHQEKEEGGGARPHSLREIRSRAGLGSGHGPARTRLVLSWKRQRGFCHPFSEGPTEAREDVRSRAGFQGLRCGWSPELQKLLCTVRTHLPSELAACLPPPAPPREVGWSPARK